MVALLPALVFGKGDDYYWIGGSGNWSDSAHWYSSSQGLPGITDNVFFDTNSFSEPDQFVNLDTTAYCHHLNISAAMFQPKFAGSEDMVISGSILLPVEGLTIELTGKIIFNTTEVDQTIQTNGVILNTHVMFSGSGSWILTDDFLSLKSVSLISGSLNLSGKKLECASFISIGGSGKTLNIANSEIIINYAQGSWNVDGDLNLSSGFSTITFKQNGYSAANTFSGGGKDYYDIIFNNDGIISGSNTFRNISLLPDHNYRIASGTIQTINGILSAPGCVGPMRISATGTDPATIAKINGDINISFVALKSINGAISAPFAFNAINCIDEGNCQGINFVTQVRDMYWINGTGNWSDTSHWTSLPVSEYSDCVPQDIDNVFFNEDSFNGTGTVTVDVNEVRCCNMTWSGSDQPTLAGLSGVKGMKIFGSLQFMPSMVNSYNSPFYFSDTLGGRTITSAGQKFNHDLYFDGKQGGWSLMDSLEVTGKIHFLYGNLGTNSNFVSCQTFQSDSAFVRTLNIGNSEMKINGVFNGNSWSINNDSLVFYSGNSSIEIVPASGCMYHYGGDTIKYHNVKFTGITGIAKLNTFSDIYASFHHVDFKSNGNILGNNSFDTLAFSPGCFYDIASGKTQKIVHNIYPTGECNGPILLKSSTNGSTAQIQSLSDTIVLNYTAIRDIIATGNTYFIAQNSVDLGNNSGWDTIMVTAPGKLYWVGGAGNWNEQMHWSLTSGGPGGECIPTPYDTVIFDQNSFSATEQYSAINLNNAFAHNMDWSNANYTPEFAGDNTTAYLRIYGSLKLNPLMNFTFPAYIWFESSDPNETIITEGIKFHNVNNNVYFDGIGGDWTLIDSLQLGNSISNQNCIYLNNGELNSNDQYVDCFSFYSTQPTVRKLSMGESEFRIQNVWQIHGINLDLEINQSTIQIDSGRFYHYYGNYFPYHVVNFNHHSVSQEFYTRFADSVLFDTVNFYNPCGKMYGTSGTVMGHRVDFNFVGQINDTISANPNIYVIDSLFFGSEGKIYGNDTVRNFVRFNSTGTIDGDGVYKNAHFIENGNIFGNNLFDTLVFSPSFSYQLGSLDIQTITDSMSIMGNNCQSIILYASENQHAVVYKDTGSIYGDFIEMTSIKASGNAVFDAGDFSIDVNNSNIGWIFSDTSLNYSLGSDISILEGETVDICAENFNGNSTTTYEWTDCETGEILSTDSCIFGLSKGHYCLSVFYTEGGGCVKTDDIYVGCHLDLLFDTTHVSCKGYSDGSIEMQIVVGLGPFEITWQRNDTLVSTNQNINNLIAGDYIYTITDTEECMSTDTISIHEPDSLAMDYITSPACYQVLNGLISIDVSGGTEPYQYEWSNGSSEPQLEGIGPGMYGITVTDDHLCPPINKSISVSELPELTIELAGTDLGCFQDGTGAVTIDQIDGGSGNYAIFEWLKDMTFYAYTEEISDLMVGSYVLRVTDDNGCTGIAGINISEPSEIELTLTGASNIETQGSAFLDVTGGVPPYSYLWSTGSTSEDITYLSGGTYTVTVTDDHSCSVTDSIFVEVHYKIFAPTAFSPNGDNYNDEFVIFEVGNDLKEIDMAVFDRFGKKVFETTNIKNYWNGRVNNSGKDCPAEVYTWFAKLIFNNGESLVYTGNVSLLK